MMNLIIITSSLAVFVVGLAFYYSRHQNAEDRLFSQEIESREDTPPEVLVDAAGRPPGDVSDDVNAILELYRRQNEAWCRGDGAAFAACYTEDADFIAFDGAHTIGRDRIAASHQELFDTFLKDTCLRGYVKRVRFLNASAAAVHVVSGTEFDQSGIVRRPSIQTHVAVMQNGEWLFSSFHNGRIDPIDAWSLPRKLWLGAQTVLFRR